MLTGFSNRQFSPIFTPPPTTMNDKDWKPAKSTRLVAAPDAALGLVRAR